MLCLYGISWRQRVKGVVMHSFVVECLSIPIMCEAVQL